MRWSPDVPGKTLEQVPNTPQAFREVVVDGAIRCSPLCVPLKLVSGVVLGLWAVPGVLKGTCCGGEVHGTTSEAYAVRGVVD